MRVHELAKEIGIPAKELIDGLKKEGVSVKSHMSAIDQSVADAYLLKIVDKNAKQKEKLTQPIQSKKKISKVQKEKVVSDDVKPDREIVFADVKPDREVVFADVKPDREVVFDNNKSDPKVEVESTEDKETPVQKVVEIELPVSIEDLADKFEVPLNQLMTSLISLGEMLNLHDKLYDEDMVSIIASEFNIEVKFEEAKIEEKATLEEYIELEDEDESALVLRPPVVTFMGHVDHGKTSLLDYIRKSRVAHSESGGITQHIGAYQINHELGKITFLDTPGHEAFTKMRARGAKVTDVVVLVIAADDGIMPQSDEAIDHCRAANVPMIIAINKMDKPEANQDKIKRQLSERNLLTEDWGGEIIACGVSAVTGEGIDHLLDMILLQTEIMELKANPNGKPAAYVIESNLSTGKGPVSTILVKNGTFRVGDAIVCGTAYGRIKAILDENNENLKTAPPSSTVLIMGLSNVSEVGSVVRVMESEKLVRMKAEQTENERLAGSADGTKKMTLEDIFTQVAESKIKGLNIILKADVKGSLEAVNGYLSSMGNKEVRVKVIHEAVGDINENDVMLAAASKAVILGFHIKASTLTRELANKEGVEIRNYSVIYEMVNDIRMSLEGLLSPEITPVVTGHASIRQIFSFSKVGNIAGCSITDGTVTRKSKVKLHRDNEVLFEGSISSLKRFKDEVKDVKEGYECGIILEGFDEIQEGDELEFLDYIEKARKLEN